MILIFFSCELDITNPNAPAEDNLNSYDAIKSLTIGMQSLVANTFLYFAKTVCLVSGEIGCVIAYFDYQELRKFPREGAQKPLYNDNVLVNAYWMLQYRIVKTANDIIKNADAVNLQPGIRSGVLALAKLSKTIAFRRLMIGFEQIPVHVENTTTPVFVNRVAAIEECLTLLEEAYSGIQNNPPIETFYSDFLASRFDLTSAIKAMQARFYLMKADYNNAAQKADEVTNESYMLYDEASGKNPWYRSFIEQGLHGGVNYWRDDADTNDTRINRYFGDQSYVFYGSDTLYEVIWYQNPDDDILLYSLNEMHLIKAEAYTRGGGGDALAEINVVRSEAGLADYTGTEILKEIYIQRSYELYLTGNHYEDLRRFKDDGIDIVEKHRQEQLAHEWIIYPDGEADVNPNTPDWP